MRRPWIKIETATPDKPEICAIATRLRIDTDSVVGKLVRLWSWAEVNRVDGNDIGVTKEFIDKLVGRKGFADALEAAGWLFATDEALQFTNFERHNGNASKIRGQTAKRVERHRQRKPTPTTPPAIEAINEPASHGSSEIQHLNSVTDVENTGKIFIEKDYSLTIPESNSTPNVTLESKFGNDIIVTESPISEVPASIEATNEEEVEEAEGSGKLPRLTKRSARLLTDEDQPMLF